MGVFCVYFLIQLDWVEDSGLQVWVERVELCPIMHIAPDLQTCSKLGVRSFEDKNRVLEFNYQKMNTFESVQCSKEWCSMNNLVNLVKAF